MSKYQVQTKKHKQKYITHLITNNSTQAWLIYRGYNIGAGFKKRLLLDGNIVKSFDGGK